MLVLPLRCWSWFACLYGLALVLPVAQAEEPSSNPAAERHWAFEPLRQEMPPTLYASQMQTPVDAFLLDKLLADGLQFQEPAEKSTWLRRVTFDLTGLPPEPSEVEAFLADNRPDAHERVLDRLFASPHFGEMQGRRWLDLVRYSDTAGFNADPERPLAYRYRDYVVRALNADRSYHDFLRDQIAGDEISPDNPEALAATGYLRMWPDESNASDVVLARQSALNDLTGNVGAVFLGLSIGCAQCHDHKFDPLLQTDFYQLQAYFSGIVLQDQLPLGTTSELTTLTTARNQWLQQTADLRRELHQLVQTARTKAGANKRLKFPAVVLEAIDTMPEERTPFQWQLVFWSERQIEIKPKDLDAQFTPEQLARREELQRELANWKKSEPRAPQMTSLMAVREISAAPPETFLLAGGSVEYPLEETPPDVPVVMRGVADLVASSIIPPRPDTSGRRTALADWLTSPQNALPHRVMVNRVWQHTFGKGLLENANDFGTQTPGPSHPELLDWLVRDFLDHGTSLKHLQRRLMTSAVYQQSSLRRSESDSPSQAEAVDPDNRLYGHFPRRRLTGEQLRDAWLTSAGMLNEELYGPGVYPEVPAQLARGWKTSPKVSDRSRRSLYIFAKRNMPYPFLQAFDLPDMHESCGCRTQTTIAPQALTLLNSELALQTARDFAVRVEELAGSSDPAQLTATAWLVAFSRAPSPDELADAQAFLGQQQDLLLAGNPSGGEDANAARKKANQEALTDLCHVLLNANEFLYLD